MIEKEKIKVGLEFKLPFREDEYDEETARNRHRKIMGEYGCKLPMYRTDLKTIEGVQLFITPYRPIFKVIDIPMDYFKPTFNPSCYLGSFIEVTCKGNTFRLSTEGFNPQRRWSIQRSSNLHTHWRVAPCLPYR